MTTHWSLLKTGERNRVYSRPLGGTESIFYWDTIFNGTADSVHDATVETFTRHDSEALFCKDNVCRTWLALKRRFPLLGCQMKERADGESVDFIVDEQRLGTIHDHEIQFHTVASVDDVARFLKRLLNGPRQLSADLPVQVYVLAREDTSNLNHVIFNIAHAISDGMGDVSVIRTFLDIASTPSDGVPLPDLEARLGMAVALEDLNPGIKLSSPRRRWRRAIAHVLLNVMQSKLQGGHTLPNNISSTTSLTPARSCMLRTSFSPELSATIMANCRKHRITFGDAFPVLTQLAHSRILLRRYIRGQISEEEWAYRKRQPMHSGGPLNLRRFLDPAWLEQGGAGEVCLSINFFSNILPFMPTASFAIARSSDSITNNLKEQQQQFQSLPHFSALLTSERFMLRCRIIKAQTLALVQHPLFLEMAALRALSRAERNKNTAKRWREIQRASINSSVPAQRDKERPIGVINAGFVYANGASTLGNLDAVMPSEYPLPISHPLSSRSRLGPVVTTPEPSQDTISASTNSTGVPTASVSANHEVPRLKLSNLDIYLHCRPAEFYLSASSSRGQMRLVVFWDGNVYADELVREWLGEVQLAAEWFLGRDSEEPKAKL